MTQPTPPAWTPVETWNGDVRYQLKLPAHRTVDLYLLKFRPERNVPAADRDDVSPADRAAYVETFRSWDDKVYRHYEGHDTGSFRSVSADHVLSWRVEPRDEVSLVFRVDLSGVTTYEFDPGHPEHPYSTQTTWDTAAVEPTLGLGDEVLVRVLSTPGRGAALGEDGLEDAFGNDVFAPCLEAYLDGDARPWLCYAEYEVAPDGPADDRTAWRKAARVEVGRHDDAGE